MTRILLFVLLLVSTATNAQNMQGTVRDKDSNKPLEGVLVVNAKTQRHTYTNDSGYYTLRVVPGDTIVYMLAFYHNVKLGVQQRIENISMSRINYALDEVEILPELEKYEREHQEMLKTYDKTVKDAERKMDVTLGTGIAVGGIFSRAAELISGKRKRDKRFLRTFNNVEEQKYISLRYNPEVVIATTKTTNDSAVAFINDNPMERDFALQSTSLELMMWIRHHFNLWAQKEKQPVVPAVRPD